MRRNAKVVSEPIFTGGGGRAVRIPAKLQLQRSVMTGFLSENLFYECGECVDQRIIKLVQDVAPEDVMDMAIRARNDMKLRHMPLMLARAMALYPTHRPYVADTLHEVIQRADELAEFVSLYWDKKLWTPDLAKYAKKGKCPLASSVKAGLARAFTKFDEYQLAKWNQTDKAVKLRDVLFLCHAKPINDDQDKLWKRLINGELAVPDTWEVALSASKGSGKKAIWTDLLKRKRLPAMALIRNLRNMIENDVDLDLIRSAIVAMDTSRVLPFRFITAARHAPRMESALEEAMYSCCAGLPKLDGKTILIVDVSGSMGGLMSYGTEIGRLDTAAALAMLVREQCIDPVVYATAGSDARRIHETKMLPARRGFALRDVIEEARRALGGGGIFLRQVMDFVKQKEKKADRIIVFTDEQDCERPDQPEKSAAKADAFGTRNYLINVSVERNGIGYGPKWVHFDGFSEAVLKYIYEAEQIGLDLQSQ